MTGDRWQRVEALFHAALQQPPERREEYLEDACGGDRELTREVVSLLAHEADPVRGPSAFARVTAPPSMSRGEWTAGQRFAHYVIGGRLGAGGMDI
ncbi:MAG TPA: hypothetical protein VM032_02040 [Vicinamibacterales bacterium]|nr:hypothetical protein [Vicinamibacterales bacterium]